MAATPRIARLALFVIGIGGMALTQALPQNGAGTTQAPLPSASNTDTKNSSSAPQEDVQEEAWRVLRLGLRNHRVADRVEAVKALSIISDNRRVTLFALHALMDRNYKVRTAAASTLGELHVAAAAPALRGALSDKEAPVMLAAAHALYELNDPAAYEIYYAILMGDKKTSAGLIQSQVDKLKDPKQMAQMGFEEGIGFVPYGGMGYEAYRAVRKRGDASARAAAARFLARDPDPVSEDALIQTALADKNQIVREAALDALAQKGDSHCIDRLEQNLHEKVYPVRYRTAALIIHLGNRPTSEKRDGHKQPIQ